MFAKCCYVVPRLYLLGCTGHLHGIALLRRLHYVALVTGPLLRESVTAALIWVMRFPLQHAEYSAGVFDCAATNTYHHALQGRIQDFQTEGAQKNYDEREVPYG